jgi:hypothetical protein
MASIKQDFLTGRVHSPQCLVRASFLQEVTDSLLSIKAGGRPKRPGKKHKRPAARAVLLPTGVLRRVKYKVQRSYAVETQRENNAQAC